MSEVSHIHVRPLEIADFDFVRDLAARQPNFTVPPPYVLWLIQRIEGSVCLVAEHSAAGLVAYLLAVPVQGPDKSIFVWQLAGKNIAFEENAVLLLLGEFRSLLIKRGVRTIVFSSTPESAVYRTIRQYAEKVFSLAPELIHALPSNISSGESEFHLKAFSE